MLFRYLNPEQLRNLCQKKSLQELKDLNHRYGDFFEVIGSQKNEVYNQITSIDQKITTIQLQIKEDKAYQEQARRYRQNVLDNLPGNPAERLLAQQGVAYVFDYTQLSLQEKLRKLERQKADLTQSLNRLTVEFRAYIQELKIVNAVIEEKEVKVAPLEPLALN
ncbi:hypothetical protein [Legionella gresilensis]|uniref:hypothetical protein n=1 Tax=Legionella gresilensis TaxID=91823 RepID=UPI0010417EBF|nr:hypothetical protein [Legionella gresilensis]